MTKEKLESQFVARALPYAGNLLILSPDDALDLVRCAEHEHIPILGVDGFFLSPNSVVSPLEHLADYSRRGQAGHGYWREAEAFITARRKLRLAFEVTLGDPLPPAG